MRIPTICVNAGGAGKTLDRRAILVLRRKELQVLVRLARTAKVTAFQRRERKEKESGLTIGSEGRGRHHGYSCVVTHNCRMRRDAFLRRALRATKDTPGRGRSASTATSGFGILKVEWGGRVRKEDKSRHNPLVAAV